MRTLLLPLLLVAACSGGSEKGRSGGWGEGQREKAPEPITVVETHEVARGSVSDLLLASAAIEAEASADLMPGATGMVLSVHRDVGDRVRKGDVLAVIENASLDAGADRARAEVRHLEAQLAEIERLYEKGAVSEREVADLRYQLENARTTAREASQTQGDTRLTAPFAGIVAARDVKVGEMATSGGRAFQVVDLSELRVRAQLPERDVGRVAVGQAATLVSSYDPDLTGTAEVTRISPVIDATTGTFEVVLTLDAGQTALRPGQFVSVQLEVDRHDDVVVVPKRAVLYENGMPVVFTVVEAPPEPEPEPEPEADEDADAAEEAEADGEDATPETPAEPAGPRWVARQVPLELGLTDTTDAEVVKGLEVGDEVIVVGHTNLRDGARVRRPSDPVPTAATDDAEADADEDEG